MNKILLTAIIVWLPSGCLAYILFLNGSIPIAGQTVLLLAYLMYGTNEWIS